MADGGRRKETTRPFCTPNSASLPSRSRRNGSLTYGGLRSLTAIKSYKLSGRAGNGRAEPSLTRYNPG